MAARTVDEYEAAQLTDVGTFFAQQRYKAGKTQRQLADENQMSQNTITRLEKGQQDFKFSMLQRLAKIFGYRLELWLVPIEGGEAIPLKPDPKLRRTRAWGENTFTLSKPRKKAIRKPKPRPAILEGPQVEYKTSDEFDIEKEMAAMRQRLGVG